MAFFCPGSGAKIKKEFDNQTKRHYDYQGSPGQYPAAHSTQVPGRHHSMVDRIHEMGPHPPVSTQFFQKMIVLHDHYPIREMELSVRKGEKVEVVKKEPDWLFVRNERGKEGYVPSRNCVAPVTTRRTRSNSRSSIPIRPVMSGEIIDTPSNGTGRQRGVAMYSSSSAGKVRRYDSPMSIGDNDMFQRINSPISHPVNDPPPSAPPTSDHYDNKCSLSSSSGVSLMDTSSPALTRAFSQEELKPNNNDNSMFSLSQSAMEPSTGEKSLIELSRSFHHHKHSSSDDSGTVDSTHLRDLDYASTIRNGESSGDEGGRRFERVSSGVMTPSMKNRPLPDPPGNRTPKDETPPPNKDETPPPVPPRNASLETSRQRGKVPSPVTPGNEDDLNPYAQPIDSITNGRGDKTNKPHPFQKQVGGARGAIVDITEKNSGVDSPYSEVFRPHKRPINYPENGRDSPMSGRRSLGGRSQRTLSPMVRKTSPLVMNGQDDPARGDPERVGQPRTMESGRQSRTMESGGQSRTIAKFRKYLWGVFICMKDFEGIDENEVSVKAGEQVLVFNQDDQFWFWVVKHKTDKSEGFVPASILRELDKKTPAEEPQHNNSLRSTGSPPTAPPTSTRPRGNTTPSLHPVSSAHRPHSGSRTSRVRSISSSLSNANSIEKVPFEHENPNSRILLAPSSPPPPYAEQDPILHPSHDSQVTTPHGMPQSTSQGIVRSRPPSFPRSRASTSQMFPNSPLSPMYTAHISQSASRLNHAHSDRLYHEHQNSYPCSPTTSGTLV